jgi:AcrR family transcriptional regulator
MGARAEAVAATRDRLLDAARDLYLATDFGDVALGAVAERAETTVQTLLRHFGSKAGMIEALTERESRRVLEDRQALPTGDVAAITAYLADHYFAEGDLVLRLLAAEHRSPVAAGAVANGRRLHRAWVAEAFAAWLDGLGEAAARRRFEQLVVATDVFTWKLMCRDGGLGSRHYRLAVGELLDAIRQGAR